MIGRRGHNILWFGDVVAGEEVSEFRT